jgi:hypothetical protein
VSRSRTGDAAHAGMPGGFVMGVTERARREVGAAEREPDEERKGRLRALAKEMTGVGRGVLVAELAALTKKYTGLP